MTFDYHTLKDIGTDIVFFSSIATTFAPPYETFDGFPRTQKVYKLILALISYPAFSFRAKVYPSIAATTKQ